MKLDDTAAAYGLFQVVFADVTAHLAIATLRLRERNEPGLAFETVFKQEFSQILKQFRHELRQLDGRSPVSESLQAVRRACETISALAVWRNDRIHARVHMEAHGYALYDWRTNRRLEISYEETTLNITRAIAAIVELEAHVPHLVHLLTWDEEFVELFRSLPELSEAPGDCEAGDS